MNLIFLTSQSPHHCFLINEINKAFPVKAVFFQTHHKQRRSWKSRLERWRKFKNIKNTIKWQVSKLLFNKERTLEAQYEKEKFLQGSDLALHPKISSKHISSFNNLEVVEQVKAQSPDLIIVFGTEILKGEILNVAKLDILNIHRGIAPKYCGGCVNDWAFYQNDFDNLGVTIHKCTEKLDAGDIVGQKHYKLHDDDKIYTLRYKTTLIALEILKKVLDQYTKGIIEYHRQGPTTIWTSKDMTIAKKMIARRNFKKYINKIKKSC